MYRRFLLLLLVLPFAVAPSVPSALAQDDGDGSSEEPYVIEIPDSVRTTYTSSAEDPLVLETQEVTARRVVREAGADRVEIGPLLLETRDGGSVADLGTLLPSTQFTVNSRGEALFLVRGSQERHLRVELDGIPLTVPWDERTDLGLLPLIGVGEIVAHRGVNSALDPPNTLAGLIEMRTRRRANPGHETRLQVIGGEANALQTGLRHERRDGPWSTTVALEHRRRDGFLLPGDADLGFHQDPERRLRLNSEIEQNALLAHFGRDVGESGGVRLLVQASDASKEVPPEAHVADARFWRYPTTQRLLVGLSGDGRHGPWSAEVAGSLDLYGQVIESYESAGYETIEDLEENDDRTLLGRLVLRRDLGERWTLAARASARTSLHEDNQGAGATELEIEQNLVAAGAEATFRPDDVWRLRFGAGYEGSTTPKTGDKPSRDGDHEPVMHAAVEHDVGRAHRVHLTASRRPRFVSMRELFSGALNRFQVNPDLGPEIQDSFELGWSRTSDRLDLSANGFWTEIDGSIEQIRLPNGRRQRVNLDAVRSVGVELGLVARPLQGLTLDLQHTQMVTRSEVDGDFDGRVADRPDWLSTFAANYVHPNGVLVRAEFVGVGPRYSLDDRKDPPLSPLTRIDPSLRFNVRLGWRHFGTGWYDGSEVFARLDNVFDADTATQLGLPEPGRTLRLGLRVDVGG